jgi:hypothetical protein
VEKVKTPRSERGISLIKVMATYWQRQNLNLQTCTLSLCHHDSPGGKNYNRSEQADSLKPGLAQHLQPQAIELKFKSF